VKHLKEKKELTRMVLLVSGCWLVTCPIASAAERFQVTSRMWHEGGKIPQECVFDRSECHGANLSPDLRWSGAPANARSFAVTIFDLDAPKSGGWAHWILFNLPPSVSELAPGAGTPGNGRIPVEASQTVNDYGLRGYGGPCPPSGAEHRYVLTVYALKADKLPGDGATTPARVLKEIKSDSLALATITVKYGR
jgi:Raf kinase inhibitor-like YbhB/YbcL family protein